MRVFQTQAMWDKVEQQWYEVFSVDGEQCSGEEYFRELETEQCLENDEFEDMEETEEYCMCCNCENKCDDFECTCQLEELDECENGNMMDDNNYVPCQCPDCVAMREADECYCEECNKDREQDLITEVMDFVFDNDEPCISYCIDKIIDTLYKFKEIGYREMKQDFKDFLED